MKKNIIVTSVFTIFIITGCNRENSKFLDLCEAAIKSQLRSPSGYKRIDWKFEKTLLSPDQYLGKLEKQGKAVGNELTKFEIDALRNGRYNPAAFSGVVEYDAPNAFGTPIRGNSTCDYLSLSGNLDHLGEVNIKVNGKSMTDRVGDMVESVKKQYLKESN
jgi:hypothetical protein